MGWHQCVWCETELVGSENERKGSWDYILPFSNGRAYYIPAMLPHYVDHGWVPPDELVADVMDGTLIFPKRGGIDSDPETSAKAVRVGFLQPIEFVKSELPEGLNRTIFLQKLEAAMDEAGDHGYYKAWRGM